jgi:hypothetical protein
MRRRRRRRRRSWLLFLALVLFLSQLGTSLGDSRSTAARKIRDSKAWSSKTKKYNRKASCVYCIIYYRYIINLFANNDSSQAGKAMDGLMTCIRFLQVLGPYWKGAADQALMLQRLSSFNDTTPRKDEAGISSPGMELLGG